MEQKLSKQQEAVLIRAQMEGGICRSTTAYAALVNRGVTVNEKPDEVTLTSVGGILGSLVERGLIEKSGPGEYHLTKEGSRVAQNLGGYPFG